MSLGFQPTYSLDAYFYQSRRSMKSSEFGLDVLENVEVNKRPTPARLLDPTGRCTRLRPADPAQQACLFPSSRTRFPKCPLRRRSKVHSNVKGRMSLSVYLLRPDIKNTGIAMDPLFFM